MFNRKKMRTMELIFDIEKIDFKNEDSSLIKSEKNDKDFAEKKICIWLALQ